MIPSRTKDFIRYFFGYIIVWILAVYLFSFLRFYGIRDSRQITRQLDWQIMDGLTNLTILGIVLGVMFILSDFILKNERIKKNSYSVIILFSIVIHTLTFYLTISIFILFLQPNYAGRDTTHLLTVVFGSKNMWVIFFYFNLVIVILNFERYVRKILGPGVMIDIIRGKYYKPRNEERIFMFLDLISSTTYAEKLGSLKFTELIQDCFFDVAKIVKKYDAEIYQYVGDEVILTWKKKRGAWKNNAFNSFFSFEELINKRSDFYTKKYGIIPEFKAGIHFGLASVGEVGEIKKEIAFLGDAVNVAARLLGMCNQYKKRFLASHEIIQLAKEDNHLKFQFIDECILKGKQSPTKIYSVDGNSSD